MATILLVDDEAVVREELGGILEDEGYAVLTARDGEEGLEAFRAHRPDMVITDAKMPRREGLSLAREILAESAHVPITMITGHGNERMAIEALRLGITDFIKKPVQLADLLAAVERMDGARLAADHFDTDALPGSAKLVSRTCSYELGNDVADVPPFVTAVIRDLAPDLAPRRRDALQLALRELLINAIEHGNLAVSYDEKTEATELGTFEELLDERSTVLDFHERLVRVETKRTRDSLSVVIEDEGDGFDWRGLPDPTEPSNLLLGHGRGVLLANLSVDELRFNEKGNRVTVIMKLGGEQPAEDAPA